jgi:hypothetical protein
MFNVTIIKKNVKNITLKVKTSGEVFLIAPFNASDEHINYILQKKQRWIEKKVEFFKDFTPITHKEKEYVSGEDFKYLGKNYRLKVIESEQEEVKLESEYLEVYIKDKSNTLKKEKLINDWYNQEAKSKFLEIIEEFNKITKKEIKSVKIRKMKTRWGSCNTNKSYINLNLELIKKPKKCIEYVILHELTHLIHPNHSKSFYNYLTLHMPDWSERRLLLNMS